MKEKKREEKKNLMVLFEPEDFFKFKQYALNENKSMSDIIRDYVYNLLKGEKKNV